MYSNSRARRSEALSDIAPNVEAQAFHGGVEPGLEWPGVHAALDTFADRPVLDVHNVPEVDGVARVEVGRGDRIRMKQTVERDDRAFGALWLQPKRRHVLGRQAAHEVRIDQLTFVPCLLVRVETGERDPVGRPGLRERPRARCVRDAAVPVEIGAAAVFECRDYSAQLGVHACAVIALVVVLEDHLPVGGDVVLDAPRYPELGQRISPQAFRNLPELLGQRLARLQAGKQEPAPRVDRDAMQG